MVSGLAASGQSIIVPSGSYVVQSAGNLVVGGNLTNNGSFAQTGGKLVFGGATQSWGGSVPLQLRDIQVSSGSTTTISTAGQTLSRTLLCNGTLNAAGNLTLLSGSAQTALIDGSGTGQVLGDVTMQRYLPSAYGYKYFSSPFQSATVSQFADELDLNAGFRTFYRYLENVTYTGWHPYVNPDSLLKPMEGYAAFFDTLGTPLTADITGVVNNGTITTSTLYNNNYTYTQGFHLMGNPYPSPIDWDAATGWTRNNIDDAVYYFNASTTDRYGGSYTSYINGVSSDGIANNIIPSMQGFFVHVSNGTYPVAGTLAMSNAVRVNNLSPTFHRVTSAEMPMIRISARSGGKAADPAVVYFDNSATTRYDKSLDALKIMNTDIEIPNLYIIANDASKLSISATPEPSDSVQYIPLGLDNGVDGWVTLKVAQMSHMPAGTFVYLDDNIAGTRLALGDSTEYKVMLQARNYSNRFALVFSKRDLSNDPVVTSGLQAYYSSGAVYVYLNQATGDRGDLVITNTLGQIMDRQSLSGYGYHQVPAQFTSGIYIVSIYSRNGVFSRKLFIDNDR